MSRANDNCYISVHKVFITKITQTFKSRENERKIQQNGRKKCYLIYLLLFSFLLSGSNVAVERKGQNGHSLRRGLKESREPSEEG